MGAEAMAVGTMVATIIGMVAGMVVAGTAVVAFGVLLARGFARVWCLAITSLMKNNR